MLKLFLLSSFPFLRSFLSTQDRSSCSPLGKVLPICNGLDALLISEPHVVQKIVGSILDFGLDELSLDVLEVDLELVPKAVD